MTATPSLRLNRLLPAVLAACAALLAGCGGSSGTASSSTTTSSNRTQHSTTAESASGSGQAGTPCDGASFGSTLQPKNAPSDVHVYSSPPATQIDANKLYLATIKTAKGDIVVCLQPRIAAKTVNNFVVLARNHFFDGLVFHRVVANFVIQGGDPTGTGSGGPGYKFEDEPVQGDYTPGCMAMANAGPNTNGSQFFICIHDDTQLPKQYNLFGHVSKGLDVATKIAQGDVMQSVTVQEQS